MRTSLCIVVLIVPLLIVCGLFLGRDRSSSMGSLHENAASKGQNAEDQKARGAEAYGRLPMAFEKNVGQSDSPAKYIARGKNYVMFLTPRETVLSLRGNTPNLSLLQRTAGTAAAREALRSVKLATVRMRFEGGNPSPEVSGLNQLPGKRNFFMGTDPKNWHRDVPTYERVEYKNLYPGIDAVFYGNQQKLEYDFVVAPGADPRNVVLNLEGTQNLRLDDSGNVMAATSNGDIQIKKPVVYQKISGERREVAANYVLSRNHQIRFNISEFDRREPLVIDPVLDYSTYLGGSASPGDVGNGIAVDASGDAFIVGTTLSSTFPTQNPFQGTPGAGIASGAAFVTELDPTGSTEIYSTYLSGDTGEFGQGIAVDALGNAYVTGESLSTDFPTTANAFVPTPIPAPIAIGFLTKLSPAGNTLLYSSLIGGSNGDFGLSVAADAAGTGNAYVTGATFSGPGAEPTLFTVQGGFQSTLNSATGGNAFLIRIDTTALTGPASLIYSTYLGGSAAGTGTPAYADRGFGIAVDTAKSAYIVGTTTSSDFPTTPANAFLSTAPTGVANGAVFVTKIDTTTTGAASEVYSTFLAGPAGAPTTNGDSGYAVALGPGNVAYVTGQTASTFYVTNNSYQSAPVVPPNGIVFVSLIDTTKTGAASVPYSARIGGTTSDTGFGIRVDSLGNAYVTGSGGSPDFPVTPGAFQSTRALLHTDAFILKLNPGSQGAADLVYSSYFGGTTGDTLAFALGLDSLSNAYLTGSTGASDFPVFSTTTPFQSTLPAAGDVAAFVSKLTLTPVLAFASPCTVNAAVAPATSCALAFGNQLINTPSTAQTFTVTNNTSSNIGLTIPATAGGTNGTDFAVSGTAVGGTSACSTTLAAGASCGIGVTFTPTGAGAESATLTLPYTYNNGLSATAPGTQLVALTGTSLAPTVTLNPTTTVTFASQPINTTSAAQTVTVSNTGTGNLILTAAPVFTGGNAGDFAIAGGTTCTNGATVTPTSSCIINVTFTPTALGGRSTTLTIADNATGSPQTLSITGTGAAAAPLVTVTPSGTVTFGGQLVTSTSAAQTVTVKNTGNSALNITAMPAISGTNASDFAVATGTTCTSGATVQPNGTCVIMLTFTPPVSTSGARSAILSIADNATGSPQTLTLSGTAWDFSLSAQPLTINQGSTGSLNVIVTPIGGFTGTVTLSCSGSIPQGTCAATTPVTVNGAIANGSVTITTKGLMVPPPSKRTPPISTQQVCLVLLAAMMLLVLPITRRFRTRLGLAGAAALLIVVAGCSSALPTQKGSYNLTITGTSGSVSRTTTATVTVD